MRHIMLAVCMDRAWEMRHMLLVVKGRCIRRESPCSQKRFPWVSRYM